MSARPRKPCSPASLPIPQRIQYTLTPLSSAGTCHRSAADAVTPTLAVVAVSTEMEYEKVVYTYTGSDVETKNDLDFTIEKRMTGNVKFKVLTFARLFLKFDANWGGWTRVVIFGAFFCSFDMVDE